MAVFPFTVRATDSEGSFSDRQFNITVRNSKVERYMMLNATHAWTSTDAQSWTQRNNMGGYSVAFGNGFWLVNVGNGIFRKTSDGVNWNYINRDSTVCHNATDMETPITWPDTTTSNSHKMRFHNGRFYLPHNDAPNERLYVLVSQDGINWVRHLVSATSNFSASAISPWVEVTEDNGTLFMNNPYYNSTFDCLGWMSEDQGVTWTKVRNINVTAKQYSLSLNRMNGLWIAGGTSTGASSQYWYSTDGVNWTINTLYGTATSTLFNETHNRSMVYANGLIYWFGARTSTTSWNVNGTPYAWSADGINWEYKTLGIFNTSNQADYLYKNGVFIAIPHAAGASNPMLPGGRVSMDGMNWVQTNNYAGSGDTQFTSIAAM